MNIEPAGLDIQPKVVPTVEAAITSDTILSGSMNQASSASMGAVPASLHPPVKKTRRVGFDRISDTQRKLELRVTSQAYRDTKVEIRKRLGEDIKQLSKSQGLDLSIKKRSLGKITHEMFKTICSEKLDSDRGGYKDYPIFKKFGKQKILYWFSEIRKKQTEVGVGKNVPISEVTKISDYHTNNAIKKLYTKVKNNVFAHWSRINEGLHDTQLFSVKDELENHGSMEGDP